MVLYSVSANTISNWVGEGLTPSDAQRPYLFQGAELQRFHKEKRQRNAIRLRPGEFKCFSCKAAVFPKVETVCDSGTANMKHMYSAKCPNCCSTIWKASNETDRDIIKDCRNPNTTRHCLHEEDSSVSSGIWIRGESEANVLYSNNDRIIHAWLTYAGRYDVKTIDRHLSAIRYFEGILAGKPFSKLTREDVAKVRDDLKRRANVSASDSLSASSIKHTISHLSAFLDWLFSQDGFKALPSDLQGYLKLPKAVLASAARVKQKDYPTLAEAELLLGNMPSDSLIDQRSKAIFALAFLGALRADTLISLRIKHIDIPRRLILQDATTVRAKAGKSIDIKWFPIAKNFELAVIEWIDALTGLGFTGEDALFPETTWIRHRPRVQGVNFKPVPVMSTKHAVTEAFAIACRESNVKYTPHAAKHCIGAERDERPLTQLERKAWSENMGHENEQITERHYGQLGDERRFEVLELIGKNVSGALSEFTERDILALGNIIVEFMRNR